MKKHDCFDSIDFGAMMTERDDGLYVLASDALKLREAMEKAVIDLKHGDIDAGYIETYLRAALKEVDGEN